MKVEELSLLLASSVIFIICFIGWLKNTQTDIDKAWKWAWALAVAGIVLGVLTLLIIML